VPGPPFNQVATGIGSPCHTLGDFDYQVDYRLVNWPDHGGFFASLQSVFGWINVARTSAPWNPPYNQQYGAWTGGAGITIRQGLRVGVSAYRGPYLHRPYAYYFPGEADPRELPASGYGVDAQWGRGPWNVAVEWQRFQMAYRMIPTFTLRAGYIEARRVMSPRLFLAARAGHLTAGSFTPTRDCELVTGVRTGYRQLWKFGWRRITGFGVNNAPANALLVQFVTSFTAVSIARD
jgi:hypothetical protein